MLTPYLAMFAAFAATILALTAKAILHTAAIWAVTALWAVALWAAKKNTALAKAHATRVRRRRYHRHDARHRHGHPVPARPLAIAAPRTDPAPFRARTFA